MNRYVLALALAAPVLALCPPAVADSDEDAREQFNQGLELYEAGRFDQASVAFGRAYELKPSYRLLYNIGQVENQLGHYTKALEAYLEYLRQGGTEIPPDREEEVRGEEARLRKLVGLLQVRADVEGAPVFVDGRRIGETPLSEAVFVDLGEHEIVIKKDGREIHREIVTVAGGQNVEVVVEVGDGSEPALPVPETPDGGPRKRIWTWVALGVGVAAGAGAGVTGGLTLKKSAAIKDQCDANTCSPSLESDKDTAVALGYTTDALIGVAAVGIAAGIVLFFIEPGAGSEKREASVVASPLVGNSGGGFVLSGRF